MPTIITTDIIDTLNHFYALLMLAPSPQPLTANDAQDIKRAANIIGKMRAREVELEGEAEELKATVAELRERQKHLFCYDEI